MEATTIDQLFTEVLEEIFSHLSASDLKNCALVCKDWNEVIASSAMAMKKLKIGYRLGDDTIFYGFEGNREETKMQSTDRSNRHYQHVEILIHEGSMTQLPSLDRFNMSQVKTLDLRFKSSFSIRMSKVVKLLSRMPLLQVLTIYLGGYCAIGSSTTLAAHFKKLKQLKVQAYIDQPITEIFEVIKANNITELTYRAGAQHSDAKIDVLAAFIKSNKSLVKLTASAKVFVQLLGRHDFSGMNLESLEVDSCGGADRSDCSNIVNENFRKSLISNAHSLTSLSIPSWLLSKAILVEIFNELKMLVTLKNLKIDRARTIDGLKMILQHAPQLKKLWLRHATDEIIKEVATSAPRLVELRMRISSSLSEVLTCDHRFNELKSLTVDVLDIERVTCLPSLLERCPKIEVFECLTFLSEDSASLIDILLHQKTLKHLRFNCHWSTANQIIFDKLKINFGYLRSLKLHGVDGKFVLFKFPDNPAEWNVEQQEVRFADFQAANPDWRLF